MWGRSHFRHVKEVGMWISGLSTLMVLIAAHPAPANQIPPLIGPAGLISGPDHGGRPVSTRSIGSPPAALLGSLELEVVGDVAPHLFYSMAFGDSDHDGRIETALYIRENNDFTCRIYETPGDHTYSEVRQGPGLIPYGLGDGDGDGLADLMGQVGTRLYVYESSAPDGHPDHLAWQSADMPNVVGYAAFADVDADGRKEILHTRNAFSGPSYLMIFENLADNQYVLVYQEVVDLNGAGGPKAVADFDGDGNLEIATSSINGRVVVFENQGDNLYSVTFSTNLGTFNAYAASVGHDMDGNGKPEFVIGGSSSTTGYVTTIYESVADNLYIPVKTITVMNGFFGVPFNATGDLDGDDVDELVIETAYDLHVYKAEGVGSYVEIATVPQPTNLLNGVICADGDRDGIDEIYWEADGGLGDPPTLIYERRETSAAGEPAPVAPRPELVAIPNPFAASTTLAGRESGDMIRVYDIAGRHLRTLTAGSPAPIWDGRDGDGRRLRPGTYFLRAGEAKDGAETKVVLLPD
jgi:hypothetical protein